MVNVRSFVKVVSVISYFIISRIILFFLLGLLVNALGLYWLAPHIGQFFTNFGAMPIARAGGMGALLAMMVILLTAWPVVLIILVFSVLFPIAYLLVGKKLGFSLAFNYLTKQHAGFLVDYFLDRVLLFLDKRLTEGSGQVIVKQNLLQSLSRFNQHLEAMPRVMRWFYRALKAHCDVGGIISAVIEQGRSNDIQIDWLMHACQEKIKDNLRTIELPSWGKNWGQVVILIMVNVALLLAALWYLP